MIKLTPHEADRIRTKEGSGHYGTDELAEMYGVSRRQIQRIVAGEAWLSWRTPEWLMKRPAA